MNIILLFYYQMNIILGYSFEDLIIKHYYDKWLFNYLLFKDYSLNIYLNTFKQIKNDLYYLKIIFDLQ